MVMLCSIENSINRGGLVRGRMDRSRNVTKPPPGKYKGITMAKGKELKK